MDPNKFALHLRLHKLHDTGVLAVILLHELLQKQGRNVTLVQGYLTVMGETCWHVWIEDEKGFQIDLGRILACHVEPEFQKCEFKFMREKPEGVEVKEDPANVGIWDARNEKLFWKRAPRPFLEFRSKCHKAVPKCTSRVDSEDRDHPLRNQEALQEATHV
jgi:hypothetical protein